MTAYKAGVLDIKINMESEKGNKQQGEFGDQISQLQNLVDQMKDGFVHAMQELSYIQDGDRILQQKVNSNKDETDERIEMLTESLHQIRMDLSSVLGEVKKSNKVTDKMSKQLESVRKEQSHMRKKMRQNEQTQENHRQNQQRESTKSDGDKDSNNNNSDYSKRVISADKLARRRQSTPAVYCNVKEGREAGGSDRVTKEPRTRPKLAPMMQPFMDSLPDNNGSVLESPEGIASSGKELDSFTTPRCESRSSVSSDKDQGDKQHSTKAQNPGRRVSFSNVNQTHDTKGNNEVQRLHLAQELLTSERKYVGQLNALRENIMLPLVTESLIHPSDINIVFPPSLAKMFDRHCCLLCALETRLGDTKWQGMHGDIFAKFAGIENANFLSQYGSYIDMFPESLSLLSHHTRKSAMLTRFLKKQLADIEDIEDEQADLLGYLLAPIQRIPAYVLHLKTVLEYTEMDHPDHFHVESCLTYLGNFLASMNPAIEQAVAAARNYQLFLSERRGSRASSFSSHNLTTSQSSTLTKDSGMQSMDDVSTYNGYAHQTSREDIPPEVRADKMGNFLATWNGSPVRLRKFQKQSLPNSYKRDRRASFPGFAYMNVKEILSQNASVRNSPRMSQAHHGRMGRRASHDQQMLSGSHQGMATTSTMSAAVPGMTYIPEQTSDDAEFAHRARSRKNSRSQSNLPELPTYGIYGEDDTDIEVRYEPSSPSSALPRAKLKGINLQQATPRYKRRFSSPVSSESSSRTTTQKGGHYYNEHNNIIFDDSDDIHQKQKHHHRQSPNGNKHQKLKDLRSEDRASSTMHLQETTPLSENHRRAHSISHMNRVGTPESSKPETLKNVWNQDNQVNGSMERNSSPRSKLKPSVHSSPGERSEASVKSNKKSNFLTGSLRNIFFGKGPNFNRKRGSHVVDLIEKKGSNSKAEPNDRTSSQSSTYRDEDGQPCSDV